MMSRFVFHLLFVCLSWAAIGGADAAVQSTGANTSAGANGNRLALVVGNSAYVQTPLGNTVNDASAIAELLRKAGFSVSQLLDANQSDMRSVMQDFGDQLRDPKVKFAVFYYAGHAIQVDWRNYLVPVDAKVKTVDDIRKQLVDVSDLLRHMEATKNKSFLIVLDACRENPFADTYKTSVKGLSQFDAPVGSLLAYATAPGNVASDGTGKHGLYTSHLLRELEVRNAKIEDAFKRVRLNVRVESMGRQIPWESTSLEEDLYLFPNDVKKLTDAQREALFDREVSAWRRIRTNADRQLLVDFIREFPSGSTSELAQSRLNRLLRLQYASAEASQAVIVRAQEDSELLAAKKAQATIEARAKAAAEAEKKELAEMQARADREAKALAEAQAREVKLRAAQAQAQERAEAAKAAEVKAQAQRDAKAQAELLAREAKLQAAQQAALERAEAIKAAQAQARIEGEARAQAAAQAREAKLQADKLRAQERNEAAKLAQIQAQAAREAKALEQAQEREAKLQAAQALAQARAEAIKLAQMKVIADRQAKEFAQAQARDAKLQAAQLLAQEKAEAATLAQAAQALEKQKLETRRLEELRNDALNREHEWQQLANTKRAAREAELAAAESQTAAVAQKAANTSAALDSQAALIAPSPYYKGMDEHIRNYAVGDEYGFRVIDQFNRGESALNLKVTQVSVAQDLVEFNNGEYRSDLMGNMTKNLLGESDVPRQFYPAELFVGKKWHTKFRQVRSNGIVYDFYYDMKVVARERITVPAGTFDAYRLEGQGFNIQLGASLQRRIWVTPGINADIVNETLVRLRGGSINQNDRQELVRFSQASYQGKRP